MRWPLSFFAALLIVGDASAQTANPVSTSLFDARAPAGWARETRPSVVNLTSPDAPLETTGVLVCDPRQGSVHEVCIRSCAAISLEAPHLLEPLDLAKVQRGEQRHPGYWEYTATGPFKDGGAWLTVSVLCDGHGLAVVGTRAASRARSEQLQRGFVSSVHWRR